MKPSLKYRFSFPIVAASLVAFSGTVHAAPVNWGTPTSIVITNDEATESPQILNEGTIGASYNNGASGNSNGVTFPSNDGTITLVESNATVGNWAIIPQATEFQKVISGYHTGPGMVYTASNLTIGQDYKVQFFNYNTPGATITSGNSVTIDDQYVIGTFNADAETQVFNISNGGGINAAQIRIVNDSWTPADGIWTGGDGNWNTVGNWQANTIGQGIDKSATFNGLTPITATVDVIRPIGALIFSGADHTLAAGTGSLTLDGDTLYPTPTVTVADGITATIAATLLGSEGMVKDGIGTLVLTGASGFTGATEITAGTLRYAGGSSASVSHSIASGAVLEFNVASGAYDAATSAFNGEGTLRKTGVGSLSWPATIGTFALDSGALIDVQEGTFTAGSYANESWGANASDLNVAADATFDTVEANVHVNKITGSGMILTGYSGAGYQNLTIGVDNGSSTFDGVITDSFAPGNLVKIGTGTIMLTGLNTYTGNTGIDDGTLGVTATGGLRFRPTTNGTTNSVSNSATGTLSFLGTVDLDLGAAVASGGNLWNLFNLTSFTGLTPIAVTSTLGSFTEVTPGTWEFPVTGAKWVFTESNGNLAYTVSATPYETWGSTYGLGAGSEGGDLDNDGLTNFEEYAFGLIPNSGSSVNSITVPLDKTAGTFSYTRRTQSLTGLTYTVWYSTDLSGWTQDTGAAQGIPSVSGEVETVPVTLTGSLLTNPKLFIQVRAE